MPITTKWAAFQHSKEMALIRSRSIKQMKTQLKTVSNRHNVRSLPLFAMGKFSLTKPKISPHYYLDQRSKYSTLAPVIHAITSSSMSPIRRFYSLGVLSAQAKQNHLEILLTQILQNGHNLLKPPQRDFPMLKLSFQVMAQQVGANFLTIQLH